MIGWDGDHSPDPGLPPRGWLAARTAIAHGTEPKRVVTLLRLLLPCSKCGARALYPCVRGLGEVEGTHLQRGA